MDIKKEMKKSSMDKNIHNQKKWLKERIKDTSIIFIIIVPLYFIFSIFVQKMLPSNFFVDSMSIRSLIDESGISFDSGDSYTSTAAFYKLLGFNSNTPHFFESLLSTLILSFFLCLLVKIEKFLVLSLSNFTTLIFTLFLYLCFFSVISKDIIAFALLLISFFLYGKKGFFVAFLSGILVYGLFFRSYWLLLLPLIFVVYQGLKRRYFGGIAIFIVVFIAVVSYLYFLFNGTYISFLRYQTHTVLSANTNINNVFPADNYFYDVSNSLNTLLNLIVPVDGLGSTSELFYYLWTYYVLYLCADSYKNDVGAPLSSMLVIACLISFIIIQGLFEPDMGSALRHQLVFSIFIINIFNNRRVFRKFKIT